MNKPIFAANPRKRDSEGKVTEQCKSLNNAWSATAEQVLNMLTCDDTKKTVAKLRQHFDENEKKWGLPYICPHYSAFRNDHRAQEDIIPQAFTSQTCVDIDDPEKAPIAIERAITLNDDEMSDWQGSVLYIEYSTRKPKAHIFTQIPKGMTIQEAQTQSCSYLGDAHAREPQTP